MTLKNKLLTIVIATFVLNTTFALKTDQNQPYHITSDSAFYNRDKHVTIFIGHVIATQGSSVLTGDKMKLYSDSSNKQIIKLIAYGKPATYSTELDSDKELLHAQAEIIHYYPKKNFATLLHHAKITKGKNIITGTYITYDLDKEIMESNKNQKNQRTTIIIQPKDMQ